MSRESLVIFLGFGTILIPFLGIPNSWKTYLAVGAGVLLVVLGYALRRAAYRRLLDRGNGERGNDSFTESHGHIAVDTDKTTSAV